MEASLPQLILPIKMERSSERLTRLGGLVILEELARAAGVWEKVDRALEGPKSGRGYQPHEFVQALVWMLHVGGRRLEELRELRAEREVLERLGLEAVPDAGTVEDWLRRQGAAGAEAIQQVSRELIEGWLQQEPEELTLDVDATEIEAEKQEAQWTYHHVKGYMPLLGYVQGLCVGHSRRSACCSGELCSPSHSQQFGDHRSSLQFAIPSRPRGTHNKAAATKAVLWLPVTVFRWSRRRCHRYTNANLREFQEADSRTWVMASESRVQFDASRSSCFRPLAVRR